MRSFSVLILTFSSYLAFSNAFGSVARYKALTSEDLDQINQSLSEDWINLPEQGYQKKTDVDQEVAKCRLVLDFKSAFDKDYVEACYEWLVSYKYWGYLQEKRSVNYLKKLGSSATKRAQNNYRKKFYLRSI